MKAINFLELIRRSESAVFNLNDLSKILGKEKSYVGVYIHRLKEKGLLLEVEKGKYCLKTHPFVIASNIIFPSYISFLSALNYYNLTTQMPVIIQVASLKSKKKLSFEEYVIKFIKLGNKKFFGYSKKRFHGKFMFIAEPEKAIIDSLFLPRHCPIDESFNALKNKLDTNKLLSYALKMNSIVLIKRLGYLLELTGIDVHEELKDKLNKRFDTLNPSLPISRNRDKKWRLIINEVLN